MYCCSCRPGSLSAKIVGVRYYNGIATVGEIIILNREPNNPVRFLLEPNPRDRSNMYKYDSNAIQVKNVEGVQIGHIPRQIAAKFAPYMVGKEKKI